jgi:hypothetical protein
MDEPTVNVKYSDYNKLREDLRSLQNVNYELEKKLAAAQLGDDAIAKLLHDTFHSAIKVVQFAVGNLEPSTVAGWPHAALVEIADAIEKIPGVDQHVAEMPPELRHFAGLAASLEEMRKERDKNKVVTMATAADFGPKTPEAAAVHAVYDAKRNAQAEESKTPDAEPAVTLT